MKIVVAVVVGVVLLGSGHVVRADQPQRSRSEACLDGCNFVFEKCKARTGSKVDGNCNSNVVRCKQDCPYAEVVPDTGVPTEKSHQRCVEVCRDTFTACLRQPENKNGGRCAADDVRCAKACPKPEPEPEMAPAPPMAVAPPTVGGGPGAVPAAVAAPAPAPPMKKPQRAARVEGAAAPAPVVATPAAAAGERVGATAPTVRSESATAPQTTSAEASTTVTHPAQNERGFFGNLACFFTACESPGSIPCLQQCGTAYDECSLHESKRGGECSTRLMHCRQSCRDASAAAP